MEVKCTQTTYFDEHDELDLTELANAEGLKVILPRIQQYQFKPELAAHLDEFEFEGLGSAPQRRAVSVIRTSKLSRTQRLREKSDTGRRARCHRCRYTSALCKDCANLFKTRRSSSRCESQIFGHSDSSPMMSPRISRLPTTVTMTAETVNLSGCLFGPAPIR